jgi:hypothetical protein
MERKGRLERTTPLSTCPAAAHAQELLSQQDALSRPVWLPPVAQRLQGSQPPPRPRLLAQPPQAQSPVLSYASAPAQLQGSSAGAAGASWPSMEMGWAAGSGGRLAGAAVAPGPLGQPSGVAAAQLLAVAPALMEPRRSTMQVRQWSKLVAYRDE